MPTTPSLKPKPRAKNVKPEITRLPHLSFRRRMVRWVFKILLRLLVWAFVEVETEGLERIPERGPMLIVSNHLGDADWLLGLHYAPDSVETLAKSELYDYPIVGKLMDAYGVIWIHRGQPDRRALRAALEGLDQGLMIAIAPEGRESLTGSLEEGTGGAAYLAWKSGAPILPVTFTGTENTSIYSNMKRLQRSRVSLTVGEPFYLDEYADPRAAIELGTKSIMRVLAGQLPTEYWGIYESALMELDEPQGGSAAK